jgi:hypothetical protein
VGPFPKIVRLLPREQTSTRNTPKVLEITWPVESYMVSFTRVNRVGYLYVSTTCDLIDNIKEARSIGTFENLCNNMQYT